MDLLVNVTHVTLSCNYPNFCVIFGWTLRLRGSGSIGLRTLFASDPPLRLPWRLRRLSLLLARPCPRLRRLHCRRPGLRFLVAMAQLVQVGNEREQAFSCMWCKHVYSLMNQRRWLDHHSNSVNACKTINIAWFMPSSLTKPLSLDNMKHSRLQKCSTNLSLSNWWKPWRCSTGSCRLGRSSRDAQDGARPSLCQGVRDGGQR